MNATNKIGVRDAVKLAEDHAIGILESTDDAAYWGEDFFYKYEDKEQWDVLTKARKIILNRVRKKESK